MSHILSWILTLAAGLPFVILAAVPQTRRWALLSVFAVAPFFPMLKAFTGVRYGPIMLDLALLCVLTGLYAHLLVPRRKFYISGMELAVIAFMILAALHVFNPLGPPLKVALAGYRILAWQLVGFLIARKLRLTRVLIRKVVVMLLITASVVALYGIKQSFFYTQYDNQIVLSTSGASSSYTSLGHRRAFSTMSSPAHLGYFMCAAILLAASILSLRRYRTILSFSLLLMSFALLLTIIRTAWIGVLCGLVLLGLLRAAETKRIFPALRYATLTILSFLLILFCLTSYFPDSAITKRLFSIAAPTEQRHFKMRVDSWYETIIPAIIANPFGYGTGSDTTSSEAIFYSHNGYLYVAIELGLLGLILAIGILVYGLLEGLRSHFKLKDPFLLAISRWTLAFWGALLIMASVGALFEVYPVILYGWFFLSLLHRIPMLDVTMRSFHRKSLT